MIHPDDDGLTFTCIVCGKTLPLGKAVAIISPQITAVCDLCADCAKTATAALTLPPAIDGQPTEAGLTALFGTLKPSSLDAAPSCPRCRDTHQIGPDETGTMLPCPYCG